MSASPPRGKPLGRPVAPRLQLSHGGRPPDAVSPPRTRRRSRNDGMFFFTYLARELRRRMRQAIFIALGLAIGVGLVLTVTAASAGVKNAQAGVLKGLYGVGTDVTVSGAAPKPPSGAGGNNAGGNRTSIQMGPNGAQMCVN